MFYHKSRMLEGGISDAEKIGAKQIERGAGAYILNRRQEKKNQVHIYIYIYIR